MVGRVPLWPYHRERLEAGGCDGDVLDRADELAVEAASQWAGSGSVRVRLTMTVDSSGEIAVDVRQRLSSLDVPRGPVAIRIDVDAPHPLPPGAAKPADRAWWDEIHRRAEDAGAHQGIAVGPDGDIIDGSTATVWIVESAHLVTPPAPPAVAGVARAFIANAAPDANIGLRVEPVSWDRFGAADEAFLTNAFGGAVAVRGRGDCVFGAVAAMFDALWNSAL